MNPRVSEKQKKCFFLCLPLLGKLDFFNFCMVSSCSILFTDFGTLFILSWTASLLSKAVSIESLLGVSQKMSSLKVDLNNQFLLLNYFNIEALSGRKQGWLQLVCPMPNSDEVGCRIWREDSILHCVCI